MEGEKQVNVNQRAMQMWAILVLAARNRQILSYGLLAKAVGAPPVAIGGFLEPVQRYCMARTLPPLTALVVNVEDGIPGDGFIGAKDVPAAQMQVFAYDWLAERAPSADDFAEI